jgi:hypothetical protein
VGEKLLRVLGDMEVTGVLDPAGVTFSRGAAKPWSGSLDGLWTDNDGKLNWYNKTSDSSELIGGSTAVFEKTYQYTETGTLLAGMVATKAGTGLINLADYNTLAGAKVLGILLSTLNQNDFGVVRFEGYVPSTVFTVANFVEGSLPSDKDFLWLHASGKMTITPPAQGSGLVQIHMGQWDNAGMILRPTFMGIA